MTARTAHPDRWIAHARSDHAPPPHHDASQTAASKTTGSADNGLDLCCRVLEATRQLAGAQSVDTMMDAVVRTLVEEPSPFWYAAVMLSAGSDELSETTMASLMEPPEGTRSVPLLCGSGDLLGYLHVAFRSSRVDADQIRLLRGLAEDLARAISTIDGITTTMAWLDEIFTPTTTPPTSDGIRHHDREGQ